MLLACLLLAAALSQDGAEAELPWSYAQRFHAGWGALSAGNLAGARRAYEAALELSPENPTCAFHLACVAAREEDEEKALEWLGRAADWGYADRAVAAFDPDLAGLRGSETFAAVLARMGPDAEPEAAERPAIELDWSTSHQGTFVSSDGQVVVYQSADRTYLWDGDREELRAVVRLRRGPRSMHDALVLDLADPALPVRRGWNGPEPLPLRLSASSFIDSAPLIVAAVPAPKAREGRDVDLRRRARRDREGHRQLPERLSLPGVGLEGAAPSAPRDRVALAASDGTVRRMDLASGTADVLEVGAGERTRTPSQWVRRLWLAPAGDRLGVFTADLELAFLDLGSGAPLCEVAGKSGCGARDVAFDPRGERVAVFRDDRLRVLRLADGVVELEAYSSCGPAYLPDGTLLYADTTGIRTTAGATLTLADFALLDDQITELVVSPDASRLLTASEDGTLRLWSLVPGVAAGRLLFEWREDDRDEPFFRPSGMLFSPAGDHVLAYEDIGLGAIHCRRSSDPTTVVWKRAGHGFEAGFVDDRTVLLTDGASNGFVDLAEGSSLVDLTGDYVHHVLRSESGERLAVVRTGGVAVHDGRSGELLYRWAACRDGASIAQTAAGHYQAEGGVDEEVHALLGDASTPLDAYAAVLLDPKRVRAAAAGIHSRVPRLPGLPEVELESPERRFATLEGRTARVVATAGCADGLLGFEVERDGALLPYTTVARATELSGEGTLARLDLRLPAHEEAQAVYVRVRAVSRTGVLSRPRVVTFRR